MKNITQSGYETITVVRSQYEPTTGQCLTISPVLWIYENPHTKEKKYFLVLASNNCVNYIFEFKSEILRVVFSDGNEYEYYGVPKAIYVKLINSDTQDRFARRHIYNNYLYRSTSKIVGGN